MAKKTGSDKAKQAIKSGVQVKEERPIKWLKRDKPKVAKAVKRANAKADRLRKKGFDIPRISAKEIKKNFTTRKEFNQFLKEVDKFVERGSEKGKKREDIWEYEKIYHGARHRTKEALKAKELEDYMEEEIFSYGKSLGKRKDAKAIVGGVSKMMTEHENALKPSKFDTSTRSKFNKMVKSADNFFNPDFKRSQDEVYKDNLILSVRHKLGDPNLEKILALMPASELVHLARTEKEFSIGFIYSPDGKIDKGLQMREFLSDKFQEMRDKKIGELKRKGTPEDVLDKMMNMTDDDYANNFVGQIDEHTITDTFGNQRSYVKYNTEHDVLEIKRKFGIK